MVSSNIQLDEGYTQKLEKLCGKHMPKTAKIKELIDNALEQTK